MRKCNGTNQKYEGFWQDREINFYAGSLKAKLFLINVYTISISIIHFNLYYSCVKFWVDARRRKPTT